MNPQSGQGFHVEFSVSSSVEVRTTFNKFEGNVILIRVAQNLPSEPNLAREEPKGGRFAGQNSHLHSACRSRPVTMALAGW